MEFKKYIFKKFDYNVNVSNKKFFTPDETIKWYLENQEWVNEVASGDYQKYYEEMYGDK